MSFHDLKSFRQKNANNQKQEYKSHIYNPEIAKDYSVNIAVLTGFLYHYTKVNKANNKNNHDEQTWVYQSLNGIVEYLGAYTIDQVRYLIKKAEAANLIIKSNFNKNKYDRTSWYALTNKALSYYNNVVDINTNCIPKSMWENSQMEVVNLPNGSGEIPTPIQDIKKDIKEMCGETEISTHTESFFQKQKPKDKSREEALSSEEARKMFDDKFRGRNTSYEEVFGNFERHSQHKGKWVMLDKWLEWIGRERVDNYPVTATASPINKIKSEFTSEEIEIISQYRSDLKNFPNDIHKFYKKEGSLEKAKALSDKQEALALQYASMFKTKLNAPQSLSSLYQKVHAHNIGACA